MFCCFVFVELKKLYSKNDELDGIKTPKNCTLYDYNIYNGLDFFMWTFLASTEAKTRSELQKLGKLEVEK